MCSNQELNLVPFAPKAAHRPTLPTYNLCQNRLAHFYISLLYVDLNAKSLKADISYSRQTYSPLATLGWGQGGGCTNNFCEKHLSSNHFNYFGKDCSSAEGQYGYNLFSSWWVFMCCFSGIVYELLSQTPEQEQVKNLELFSFVKDSINITYIQTYIPNVKWKNK